MVFLFGTRLIHITYDTHLGKPQGCIEQKGLRTITTKADLIITRPLHLLLTTGAASCTKQSITQCSVYFSNEIANATWFTSHSVLFTSQMPLGFLKGCTIGRTLGHNTNNTAAPQHHNNSAYCMHGWTATRGLEATTVIACGVVVVAPVRVALSSISDKDDHTTWVVDQKRRRKTE